MDEKSKMRFYLFSALLMFFTMFAGCTVLSVAGTAVSTTASAAGSVVSGAVGVVTPK